MRGRSMRAQGRSMRAKARAATLARWQQARDGAVARLCENNRGWPQPNPPLHVNLGTALALTAPRGQSVVISGNQWQSACTHRPSRAALEDRVTTRAHQLLHRMHEPPKLVEVLVGGRVPWAHPKDKRVTLAQQVAHPSSHIGPAVEPLRRCLALRAEKAFGTSVASGAADGAKASGPRRVLLSHKAQQARAG